MASRYKEGLLPFKVVAADEALVARSGLALPPWYRTFAISTIRWKLYQTAGAVVKHAHQMLLKLAAPMNKIALFCKFRLKCYELSYG